LGSVTAADGVNVEEYESEQQGPIETTQQFLDWFSGIEGEMERDQEDVYRYRPCDIIATVLWENGSGRTILLTIGIPWLLICIETTSQLSSCTRKHAMGS
jgi:hypothetical protein